MESIVVEPVEVIAVGLRPANLSFEPWARHVVAEVNPPVVGEAGTAIHRYTSSFVEEENPRPSYTFFSSVASMCSSSSVDASNHFRYHSRYPSSNHYPKS